MRGFICVTFEVETSVVVHDVEASVVKFPAFLALLLEHVSVKLRQLVQRNSYSSGETNGCSKVKLIHFLVLFTRNNFTRKFSPLATFLPICRGYLVNPSTLVRVPAKHKLLLPYLTG